ncbi:hypothetical protein ACFSO7_02990 [Bacillus sp. CGMCC 1.16607]|uniref:hypothetical protein n=1 Tax=Bacillus sp. CGMCC 1.16607 TaxID=3351842 RepID=UPI00363C9345
MNEILNKFINLQIEPRRPIINERSIALDWKMSFGLPNFILDRAEEIKTMYMLGMDVILMKFIPIFIEDILKSLVVNFKADYFEQISELYKDYEGKKFYFWNYLKEVEDFSIFIEEDLKFCQRYVHEKIRNNEIHNKEYSKYSGTKNYLTDTETGEVREADEQFEKMIESDPSLLRAINSNKTVEAIQQEVVGILNLIQRNALLLNRSGYLATKEVYDGIGKVSSNFKITVDEVIFNDLEIALNQNPLIKTFDILEHNEKIIIELAYKKAVLNAEVFQTLSSIVRIGSIQER